ncbi:carbohydrate binding domain-containing protein [Flavobacterium sp. j3]|jgi:PKD repeat protein|uniref:Carbohydrate binding domain-containing protein n=1 Tax=Flavobacterium aureirubrum TaxID=3133147 RepID=A0ABU9N4I0_9FLAO
MYKSIKILSFFAVIINLVACDTPEEVISAPKNFVVKYTYVKEAEAGKITFINTTENADSYFWDFGDGTSSTIKNPVKTFTQTGEYSVRLTCSNLATSTVKSYVSTISVFVFQGGLILNGDFEGGINPWRLGVANPIPSILLVTENQNTYFSVNVTAAGNPFDVNLSQIGITMTQGTTYRLTFDAWSDINRSMVVGIGLSGAPFTNQSVTRNITPTVQSFSIDLVANFSSANSRVIFDLGAAVGRVNIDNVTLNVVP